MSKRLPEAMGGGERQPGRELGKHISVDGLIAGKRTAFHQRHQHLPPAVRNAPLLAPLRDPNAITVGTTEFGEPVLLPLRPRLEHMRMLGATGSGKTNAFEYMIRQDIVAGRGVCVADPHGNHPDSLYRNLIVWLHESGIAKSRKIHLIDPNTTSHTVGFNPLDRSDSELQYSVIAEAVFEAFERMWGDEDGNSKPTIQRVLTATFTALSERQLTLAEARLLFDPDDSHGIRAMVLGKLEDAYAFDEIDWLHRIGAERTGRRDFRAEVVGPINRIAKLVRNEALRVIVGQTEQVIDLREAMDEGHIILANLSGGSRVYEQGADLLGRLLIRFMFFHARRRKNPDRPFFIWLDECHRYLSGDLPNIFAEIRKYGCGVIAGGQWLALAGKRDDPVREALAKGPNIKMAFRITDLTEAAEVAESVVRLDLEQPVKALSKPTVVGHKRTVLRGQGTGSNRSHSYLEADAVTVSASKTLASSVADTVSESEAESITESHSDTTTRGTSHTEGSSFGTSESFSEIDGTSSSYGESLSDTRGSSGGWSRDYSETSDPQTTGLQGPVTTSGWGSSGDSSRSYSDGSNWQEGSSHATTVSSGSSQSESVSDTESESFSVTDGISTGKTTTRGTSQTIGRSEADTRGVSIGKTKTSGVSSGTSESSNLSEAFEPVYANLPSAVHGKDNALYMAARELMSLRVGEARIAYVGENGRAEYALRVPRVRSTKVPDELFNQLRQRLLERSPSAVPMAGAMQALSDREAQLRQEADAGSGPDEPETPAGFRVKSPKSK
jgi:Type IV secretion-system coupling protein DNA-binding domain